MVFIVNYDMIFVNRLVNTIEKLTMVKSCLVILYFYIQLCKNFQLDHYGCTRANSLQLWLYYSKSLHVISQ